MVAGAVERGAPGENHEQHQGAADVHYSRFHLVGKIGKRLGKANIFRLDSALTPTLGCEHNNHHD
jgi:hypothetical protein